MSHRWLVRAVRVGPTRDHRFFTSAGAGVIAGLLPGTPVCYFEDNGRLDHPPRARVAEFTVGHVESARLEGSSVFAVIVIEDDRMRRDLMTRERDGRRHDVGVSLQLDEVQLGPALHAYFVIEGAVGVTSLDFVDDPAGDRACVLRSVPEPKEDSAL
jgi:hypothetical protein